MTEGARLYEILIRFDESGQFQGAHQISASYDPNGVFAPVMHRAEPVSLESLAPFFDERQAGIIDAMNVLLGERDTARENFERAEAKLEKARADLNAKEAERSHLSQQLLKVQLECDALKKAAQEAATPASQEPQA